jgi:hypothetical protein
MREIVAAGAMAGALALALLCFREKPAPTPTPLSGALLALTLDASGKAAHFEHRDGVWVSADGAPAREAAITAVEAALRTLPAGPDLGPLPVEATGLGAAALRVEGRFEHGESTVRVGTRAPSGGVYAEVDGVIVVIPAEVAKALDPDPREVAGR